MTKRKVYFLPSLLRLLALSLHNHKHGVCWTSVLDTIAGPNGRSARSSDLILAYVVPICSGGLLGLRPASNGIWFPFYPHRLDKA